jgi:hypothetical protein
MSADALIYDDPRDARIAALEEKFRKLTDLCLVQVAELRDQDRRIRAFEGVGAPIDRSELIAVKTAAIDSGMSESGIRKMAKENRIAHLWVGRKLFLTELPVRRK